jgi:hypothetical protein
MYVNPVLLPQFSNREDFLLTLSVFDDDTGSPVNLSGTTTQFPTGFTGSSWTVTDGAILTNSTTPITIPGYPIGSQLSALSLTVGDNLGILPGDPITISDPTGLNTMVGYVASYNTGTGALVCQIGLTFQFEIRHISRQHHSSGYAPFYDLGIAPEDAPILSASLGNGITIIDQGFLQIRIPEAQTRRLRAKTYLACLTATDSQDTRQLFIAKLPEQYGGVTN